MQVERLKFFYSSVKFINYLNYGDLKYVYAYLEKDLFLWMRMQYTGFQVAVTKITLRQC